MKDGGRIVLFRDPSNLAQVVASIAAKRVLPLRGVVEIDKLVVPADALGIITNLGDGGAANLVEELVVLDVFP